MARVSAAGIAILSVVALQDTRHRAGLAFGRSPREVTIEELGNGIEGGERLLALLADPLLSCSNVSEDGTLSLVTEQEVALLRDALTVARKSGETVDHALLAASLLDEQAGGDPQPKPEAAAPATSSESGEPDSALVGGGTPPDPEPVAEPVPAKPAKRAR